MIALNGYELGHVDLYDNWAEGPSSSGRIGIRFSFIYEGPKTIKYCTFTFVPINAVDDVVACTRTGKVELKIQITGPLKSGRYSTHSDGWYNNTIRDILSPRVYIQYMDGSTETITEEQVCENTQEFIERQQRQQLEAELRRRQEIGALLRFSEDHPVCFQLCFWLCLIIFGLLFIALLIHITN